MKNIISTILVIVILAQTINANNYILTRKDLYMLANEGFIEMELKNALSDKDLQREVYLMCIDFNLNYVDTLILAFKESSFRANALNYNEPKIDEYGNVWMGASYDVGIMQLNIPADRLDDNQHLFDAKKNIKSAMYKIRDMIDRYKPENRKELMILYNMGEKNLEKYRNGELTLSEDWEKRQEDVEKYIEQEIRKSVSTNTFSLRR